MIRVKNIHVFDEYLTKAISLDDLEIRFQRGFSHFDDFYLPFFVKIDEFPYVWNQ